MSIAIAPIVLVLHSTESQAKHYALELQQTIQKDSTKKDSLASVPYSPSRRPTYRPKDRFGDPFSSRSSSSPLLLSDPSSLKLDVEIDTGLNYTIYEKIGDLNYRPTSSMSFEDFKQYQERQQLRDYWKNRSSGLDGESAVSGRNLIPPIYISPLFDRIFGGTYVEIIPRGFVTLDFGGRWQRINNPAIPIRQQRNGGFEFDQQISMNVVGKIGEKLQVTANFDNNNSFDFENNLKVEYTGYEEDMLQKLEIGNVSLPLNNSLINGAQNLFGVKAQLQFGDLYVTTVASTQRGKSETITIEGGGSGGQGRQFQLQATNYDENRHFFLSQFFRENYERWLNAIPNINSGVNVTRVEVYVVNRNNDTQTTRNVVGLMDLGEATEGNIYNDAVVSPNTGIPQIRDNPVRNEANTLFDEVLSLNRDAGDINAALAGIGLENGTGFETITTARRLDPSEFTVDRKLGYISLLRKLQNDEALAVSFEYIYQDGNFKVGELSEDYANVGEEEAIFLKLLRPRTINIDDEEGERIPTWDLMMKNIYAINATNVSQDGFELRVIYRDDLSGIDNPQLQFGAVASTLPLIQILGLDRFNPNNDPQPDGNFDFVEGITINTSNGLVIFPFLEPFNTPIDNAFLPSEDAFREKFVFSELYDRTRINAELVTDKNKYVISGVFSSGSSNEIIIPGFNIAEGSVRVFAGGSPLVENVDYTVDYTFGKVNIINEGVLLSGKTLSISYEQADLFNFQSRTLLGTRLDYKLSDDVNFGATLLHLNERPLITRNSVGNEPIRNTKYGFDVNIRKDSRFITKMLDKLPLISTKEPSSIAFSAEFAQLIPGTSNIVDGEGTSYIDDFENSATPFSLSNPNSWFLAATPEGVRSFQGNGLRGENDFRAKLAWYSIDNLFYRSDNRRPDGISSEELENHYVRGIEQQEIFSNRDLNIINFQQTFDLAFYPNERGQYNYTTELDANGNLDFDPRRSWGGITNAIRSEVDFNKANVEYIEFWLMDPFIQSPRGVIDDGRPNPTPNTRGGDLYFNLGSISEDVIPDNAHGFENGLPPDGDKSSSVELTEWGFVTTEPFLTNAFDNDPDTRGNQDVGLDGATDAEELVVFDDYLNGLGPARVVVEEDPSADNFTYFLGDELDQRDATLLERYKNFNGMENNSPVISGNALFTPSGSNVPDNEDLNADNTLSELEEYYEYHIPIEPAAGGGIEQNEFIVDQITNTINGDQVTWYLYRIPIRQFSGSFGGINSFESIRYLRTYLTNFSEPIVLRMVNFRFVASRWRRYLNTLEEANLGIVNDSDDIDNFTVSVVNIEENGRGTDTQSPYVLPPGFERDQDNTSALNIRLNEQSLQVCVDDLEDGDARAVIKQVQLDLINYGRIKMFIHAESQEDIPEGELTAFLRLGEDVDSNYYEIEVPLRMTLQGSTDPFEIWPQENEIDIDLDQLYALKSERDRLNISKRALFPFEGPRVVGNNQIRLRGNPDLSSAKWLSIGIRNPASSDGRPLSACIWANELRVSDFDRTAGWAANATLNTKLADFANITATTQYSSFGFGGIQSRIAERTREETSSYDISANINVDKLLPEQLGLQIPMYVSYERTVITPRFDPANPDINLDATLLSFETEEEREDYKRTVQDRTTRRSINFTNVRKVKTNPEAKNRIWDVENFAFTYAFSEVFRTNFNLQRYSKRNFDAAIAYNFSPLSEPVEPFKNIGFLDKSYLKLIKDFNFNLIPSKIGFRADLRREIIQTVYRNNEGIGEQENFQKFFTLDRNYNAGWNLTKSITLDYNSRANAIIDEPEGEINTDEARDSIRTNLENLGRMKNFDQTISANYTLPLDKIPITDWISADYRYSASYSWQAGPFYQDRAQRDSLDYGNIIQNSRDNAITGKLDLVKLYNKINYLKNINSPPSSTRRSSLRSSSSKAPDPEPEGNKAVNSFLRLLMSLRSINATVGFREGTIIPGFTPRAFLLGLDSSFSEPGIPFLLGSQDPNIRRDLANEGFITRNPDLTAPFTQTQSVDINIRADVSLSPSVNIQLTAKKLNSASFEEIFRFDPDAPDPSNPFVSLSPSRSGSYSISYLSILTSFTRDRSDNSSPIFEEFERNRFDVLDRFQARTGVEYDTNSQDVLIPAFLAAYSGRNVDDISLSPFPRTPIPNWRIDYTGLNKIPAIQEKFQSITINHAYQSNYSVVNYSNSLEYSDGLELNRGIEDYNDTRFALPENDLVPLYVISQVVVSEQFAPLIGVNIRTKKRLTAKVEYRTQRDLALNITNAQVTEQKSNDVVFELGFTKAGMKMPWKAQGRSVTLKNDLTFRFNFTIRDTQTIQRRIDETDQVTGGDLNIQIRPNFDYVINDKLNLRFYFERTIREPKISSGFPQATTRLGFQVTFSLAQ